MGVRMIVGSIEKGKMVKFVLLGSELRGVFGGMLLG